MEFFQANINLKEVLVQLIAFVIVFLSLKKMAWKPVLGMLESRRAKIAQGFDDIEKTKHDLESLKTQYDEKLKRIEEEARVKIQDAIQEGKKLAKDVQETARNQAREILEKTKEDIKLETEKARVVLRKEIAELAYAATERLVKEKMSAQKDNDLIMSFIDELEKMKTPMVKS